MADSLQTPLKTVPNFRDVGDYIDRIIGAELLKKGFLYRGARPDEASPEDRQRLVKEYGIRGIVDLRTKTEHIEQAQKRDAKIKASAAIPQSNNEVAEPLKISGIAYHEINFNGSGFSRMLISKLSWIEFFRLVGLMLIGSRKDAIKVLSPHMEEMGLVGLGTNSLDACKREVKLVFDVLADERNLPVLVHCTQGKDRTGLIVMLVLSLLDVDREAIRKDYMLSESELASEKESRLKELASIGLTEQFAVCHKDFVESVQAHMQDKYGGTQKYLEACGLSKEAIEHVKRLLLA